MNIFEILSQGKGSINEENISSFLAYLLKDNETHGLRREFVKRFIELTDIKYNDVSDYSFYVELEKKFSINQKKDIKSENIKNSRTLDILLTITDDYNKYVIGIENKIDSNACDKKQLLEEYLYMRDNNEQQSKNGKKII